MMKETTPQDSFDFDSRNHCCPRLAYQNQGTGVAVAVNLPKFHRGDGRGTHRNAWNPCRIVKKSQLAICKPELPPIAIAVANLPTQRLSKRPNMLDSVFESLASAAPKWQSTADWPGDSLRLCGENGIFSGLAGFAQPHGGGKPWNTIDQIEALIGLAKADLVTTFIITQHIGAIKRIAASDRLEREPGNDSPIPTSVLPNLLDGNAIASVGISHLTTSRLHLGRPAVQAKRVNDGYVLNGTIPWVTGAPEIQYLVAGATLPDGRQILVLLSLNDNAEGTIQVGSGVDMISMSASCTDAVTLENLYVPDACLLSGPRDNVLAGNSPKGITPSGAGGLQTSALALGLSYAALDYLREESAKRENLQPIVRRFDDEHQSLHHALRAAADGDLSIDSATIRSRANGLVGRTTSAAMTTAKGAGLISGHPVARWCCQAFFFLVWSCPQPVAEAHLCELVGIED